MHTDADWNEWEVDVRRRIADGSIWDEINQQRSPEQIAADHLAQLGKPPLPLSCFVCREPILETFVAYPCCDECLEAPHAAPGISFDDRDRLLAESEHRQEG